MLELSSVNTWQTFLCFSEAIPVFSNLFRLSITTDFSHYYWELLPKIMQKSPNLQTLVIKGPLSADKHEREYGLSCTVKILEITEFEGEVEEILQIIQFLEKLPYLELFKVRAYATNEEEKSRVTKRLLMLPRSSKCTIEIKFYD